MRIRLDRTKWNPAALLVITVALYSVTTLSYTLWPKAVSPNRVLGLLIVLELAAFYLCTLRRRDLFLLATCFFTCGISFLLCADHAQNLTDAAYFAATVLLLWKLADRWAADALFCALRRLRTMLQTIVLLDNLLLMAAFCFPTSYIQLWGAAKYFQGFTNSTHTLCAGVCLLLALTLFLLRNVPFRLHHPLYLLPGLLAIAMSGARTYLVSALVIVLLYIVYETPPTKLRLLFLPFFVLGTAYLALFSGMAEKLTFLQSSTALPGSLLARLTSGRTEFWALDLDAFLDFDCFHLLFGQGFDFVYTLNETVYGVRIWAHNDVLDLLLSTGLFGTALYGYVIYAALWTLFRRAPGILLPMLLAAYLLFVLLVNGFFGYQHYVYSFAVLALTFMDRKGDADDAECDRAGL